VRAAVWFGCYGPDVALVPAWPVMVDVAGLCTGAKGWVISLLFSAVPRWTGPHAAFARLAGGSCLHGDVLVDTGQRAIRAWLGDCGRVEVVVARFGQQEDVLVRPGAPIADALRHGIGFAPYYVLPQVPAVSAEGECQHPRDTD